MAPEEALTNTSRVSLIKRDTKGIVGAKYFSSIVKRTHESSKACMGITDRAAVRSWTVGHVALPESSKGMATPRG